MFSGVSASLGSGNPSAVSIHCGGVDRTDPVFPPRWTGGTPDKRLPFIRTGCFCGCFASDRWRLRLGLGESPNNREGCFFGPRFTGVLPSAISSTLDNFVPLDQVPSQIELRDASGPGGPPRRGLDGSGGRFSWCVRYGDFSGCP